MVVCHCSHIPSEGLILPYVAIVTATFVDGPGISACMIKKWSSSHGAQDVRPAKQANFLVQAGMELLQLLGKHGPARAAWLQLAQLLGMVAHEMVPYFLVHAHGSILPCPFSVLVILLSCCGRYVCCQAEQHQLQPCSQLQHHYAEPVGS